MTSMEPATVRLNKYIAHSTGISRREADDLIAQGRVAIDGAIAPLGAQADPVLQRITIDNKLITANASYTYVALHKPVGYVCSRRRQGDNPTIYELLPAEYHALKPVGRLDRDSSGILLLTDDGDFAHQMTHPSFHKTKTYEVTLDLPLQPLHRQMISDHGVTLEDGPSKLQLTRLNEGDDTQWTVSMHEGRNRQIRRTFAALGYTVTKLHRTTFGAYNLGDLVAGKTLPIKI